MAEQPLHLYEAMFLVEPDIATDWEAAKGMVQTIMDRAKAKLLACRLWDERRLAYAISKHKRAVYILCYFQANGSAISGIERDVQLSEHLLRVLVLRADHITDEELEQIKAMPDHRLQPAHVPSGVSAAAVGTSRSREEEEDVSSLEHDEQDSPKDDFADDLDNQTDKESKVDDEP